MSIGDVYRMTGKFELAGKNYSEAIKISGKLKDRTTAADAAVGLGLSARGARQVERGAQYVFSS